LSEKLELSKIIAKKGLSERVFQGFKPNRQRNVVPIIFSNDSWIEFSYINSIESEAEVLKLRRSCGIILCCSDTKLKLNKVDTEDLSPIIQ